MTNIISMQNGINYETYVICVIIDGKDTSITAMITKGILVESYTRFPVKESIPVTLDGSVRLVVNLRAALAAVMDGTRMRRAVVNSNLMRKVKDSYLLHG
jgi:hypothetical protein